MDGEMDFWLTTGLLLAFSAGAFSVGMMGLTVLEHTGGCA